MSLPDFKEPLLIEIQLALQMNATVDAMLPCTNSGDQRTDLTAALARIALEHIQAILLLFANGMFASGYALMRPSLESAYKCIWIASVAEDTKVSRAYKGHDVYGDLKKVISDLEAKFEGTSWATMFAKIRPHIRALHERTHSGAEQTLRRLKAEDMRTPDFEFGEVIRDIRTLAAAAILVAAPRATPEDVAKLNGLMLANYSWLSGSAAV